MESRVMGNCHARFGAGENLEERVCSMRLHTLTKGSPIAIMDDGCGSNGAAAARTFSQADVRRAELADRAVGHRISAALSRCKYSGCHRSGLH